MSQGAAHTPPLLALLASRWLRRQVRAALNSGEVRRIIGPVIFASGWPELRYLTRQHLGSPAVVDPLFGGDADPFSAEARDNAADWSSVSLICYARLSPVQQHELQGTGVAFSARLQPGIDDTFAAIDAAVLRSIDVDRPRRLIERLRRRTHKDAQAFFERALNLAFEPFTVADLADDLEVSVRGLQRRCVILGVPSPKVVGSLARIFTVERLAEWSRQPSGRVARALGFSDRANYRRLMRHTVGAPPSAVRQRGGTAYVAEIIVHKLAGIGIVPSVSQNDPPHRHTSES